MSYLVISLDFELHWGIFDKVKLEDKGDYFQQTRKMIPQKLSLLEQYQVAVTWATVGMLLTESLEEWGHYSPDLQPAYSNMANSPYQWVKQHGYFPAYHSAMDLVKGILNTAGQELGSHTYSHYYTMEEGQNLEQFRADLKANQRVFLEKAGLVPRSLVFPRNQYGLEYLKVCKEEGFTNVRINPSDWFWRSPQSAGIIRKTFRTADTLLPLGNQTSFSLDSIQVNEELPVQLPSSRFLRPIHKGYKTLQKARLGRIISEMTFAAQNDLIYHLWWHPHNFGYKTTENLKDLTIILEHYQSLHQKYGMESVNMGQLTEMLHGVERNNE
ncbi:polysaccharide deacetylase family protein [Echinicola sp. CAU 1574]|uniref:Polysaccharide deacetylase family protein n=1 Tax=Echinicola arenosa TaxID=2774144 RepID=A0ABR9APF3_9BACT|nr:polysaccharide deacetylase family protein [Echinicola arenosa]MBD8490449.1 polysaccharide deacetylase family protein [Echinicola arenosa]